MRRVTAVMVTMTGGWRGQQKQRPQMDNLGRVVRDDDDDEVRWAV